MAIYAITAALVVFAIWAVVFCVLCGSMVRRLSSAQKTTESIN